MKDRFFGSKGIVIQGMIVAFMVCLLPALASAGRNVRMQKQVYTPDEAIVIQFEGLPGNAQDWITVVAADAAENKYGEWFYTGGRRNGTHTFKGLPAGRYEVRVYFNWPKGGYVVQDRQPFEVRAAGGATGKAVEQPVGSLAWTQREVFAAGEAISVTYAGLPGNAKDWITIVGANAPENTYGEWFYTQGQRSGTRAFKGLGPGAYEIRVYFNWPAGGYTVRSRFPFSVR